MQATDEQCQAQSPKQQNPNPALRMPILMASRYQLKSFTFSWWGHAASAHATQKKLHLSESQVEAQTIELDHLRAQYDRHAALQAQLAQLTSAFGVSVSESTPFKDCESLDADCKMSLKYASIA